MKKRYSQHFRDKWLQNPKYANWLAKIEGNDLKSFCKYCYCTMSTKVSDIEKHSNTNKHKKAEEKYSTRRPDDDMTPKVIVQSCKFENRLLEIENDEAISDEVVTTFDETNGTSTKLYTMGPHVMERQIEDSSSLPRKPPSSQKRRFKDERTDPEEYESDTGAVSQAVIFTPTTSTVPSRQSELIDECDLYCRSLAAQMKSLNKRDLIEIQLEFQRIMAEKRLKSIDGDSGSASNCGSQTAS